MANDLDNREEIPSTDAFFSPSSAQTTIVTIPFPFTMPSTQLVGPSTSYFSFSFTSTTSSIYNRSKFYNYKTLSSLQTMLA